MNVWVNSDGTRNRDFRPYIDQEEQGNSVYPYSPNSRGFHYGLYDTAQPSCGTWLSVFNQYPSRTPSEVVDRTGRLHIVRPGWWKNGYKHDYNNILPHIRPT